LTYVRSTQFVIVLREASSVGQKFGVSNCWLIGCGCAQAADVLEEFADLSNLSKTDKQMMRAYTNLMKNDNSMTTVTY